MRKKKKTFYLYTALPFHNLRIPKISSFSSCSCSRLLSCTHHRHGNNHSNPTKVNPQTKNYNNAHRTDLRKIQPQQNRFPRLYPLTHGAAQYTTLRMMSRKYNNQKFAHHFLSSKLFEGSSWSMDFSWSNMEKVNANQTINIQKEEYQGTKKMVEWISVVFLHHTKMFDILLHVFFVVFPSYYHSL